MMRRALLLLLAGVLILSLSAIAAGPTIGFFVQPTVGAYAGFSVGYNFPNPWAIELSKEDFADWMGDWSILALWQPGLRTPFQDTIGPTSLRAGPKILWDWKTTGGLQYSGLEIILGLQHYWDLLSFYGELRISSTGLVYPAFGLQVEISLAPVAIAVQTE